MFLIRALWMGGRVGQEMLQAYDSDKNLPSVAASDAGPSHRDIQQTSGHGSPDPARLSPGFGRIEIRWEQTGRLPSQEEIGSTLQE